MGNPNMDEGEQFTVVYNPADLDDVRIIPSPLQLLLCFGGMPAGLSMMLLALGINPKAAVRWMGQEIRTAHTRSQPTSPLPAQPITRRPEVAASPRQNLRSVTARPGANSARSSFGRR